MRTSFVCSVLFVLWFSLVWTDWGARCGRSCACRRAVCRVGAWSSCWTPRASWWAGWRRWDARRRISACTSGPRAATPRSGGRTSSWGTTGAPRRPFAAQTQDWPLDRWLCWPMLLLFPWARCTCRVFCSSRTGSSTSWSRWGDSSCRIFLHSSCTVLCVGFRFARSRNCIY